jgi:signal transduction histidine kinase
MNLLQPFAERNERILAEKGISPAHGMVYINEKLLLVCIEILLLFGTIAYIPSLIFSIQEKMLGITIISSLALLLLFTIFIMKSAGYLLRIYMLLFLTYILGILLLIVPEFKGTGLLYLIVFSVIASIFLHKRYALLMYFVNFFTVAFFVILIYYNDRFLVASHIYSFNRLIVVAINFLLIDAIITLTLAFFVDGIKKSLQREEDLKQKLKKKSERLIEAKVRAEESDHLKSAFLANVSHEFRTPMNSIIGFTEIMLYTNPPEEKCKRYLQNIQKSSEQLLQIINNTIEYSKIELGTISFDAAKFSIYEILTVVHEQLKPKCPQGIDFIMSHYLINDNLKIVSDRQKLSQIFTNLILNSFKFTEKGSVSFGLMESAHQDFYQFYVSDTGIGIRKEKQKEIFTRFHKEDDFKEGTGLGLSISATLIYHMSGRIWLESEPGKGTSFYFILPKELSGRKGEVEE